MTPRILTLLRGPAPAAPRSPVRATADAALEYEVAARLLEAQGDVTGKVTISPKLARMLAALARREARRIRSGGTA